MGTAVSSGVENEQILSGVSTFSELIAKYGPLVVLLSIFFILFIILVIVVIKSNGKLINILTESNSKTVDMNNDTISQLVNAALDRIKQENPNAIPSNSANNQELVDLVKKLESEISELKGDINNKSSETNNNADYHKDIIGAYIDVNMILKDASRKALQKLDCDRVAIYVFHNGNNAMYGLPFFKMSCIHEWTKTGIKTKRMQTHTDIPLNFFYNFIENIYKDGYYSVDDINADNGLDSSIKEFIAYSDTESMYIVNTKAPVTDAITGFVVAEFNEKNNFEHDDHRNEYVKDVLIEMAATVAPLLGTEYKFKKKENKEEE